MITFEYDHIVGGQIKYYRQKLGMTQEDLSAQLMTHGCDITRSAIAKIEVGQRHVYAHEIKALTKILKVTYEELLI
ncbi:MAG: helix-turn-helix domain-containing protein [Clostridiales Family XIII bacterium]|nr:helix-turn-helix domain-containing protein [Clostridiales Family XIII bacterium]